MRSVSQDILAVKGLDFDTHESLFSKDSLAYMLNGDITGFENSGNSAFVQNALSNELCFKYPHGYEFLGAAKMDRGQFTLFFRVLRADGTYSSEIGLFDSETCAYVAKVNDQCLGLETEIRATYKTLSGCDKRRVYWVEAGKPIRFIDMDDCLPVKDVSSCFDCDKDLVFDCDAFNLNRCVTFPELELKQGLGNLPNGSYQVAMALTDDEQRFTEYYIYPEVIRFHTNNQGNNRFGIEVSFKSCPSGFQQYEMVLISHRTDRGTLAQRVGYFGVEQTTLIISEIDDTTYVPVDLGTLSEVFPHYQSATGLAQNNDQLILTGVTYRDTPNYQPIANKIESNWVEIKVKAKDAPKYKSYMRGETYAHEIRFVYCDGQRTPSYHIWNDAEKKIKESPGGGPTWNDLFQLVTNFDNCTIGDPCNEEEVRNWQVYDSSTCEDVIPTFGPEIEACVEVSTGPLNETLSYCDGTVPPTAYTGVNKHLTITVRDIYGNPVKSSTPIVVEATYLHTDCVGDTETYTLEHVLEARQATYRYVYSAYQQVDCQTGACVDDTTELVSWVFTTVHLDECGEPQIDDRGPGPCTGEVTKIGNFSYWESTLQYPDNPCVWGQRHSPSEPYYDPYGLSCQKVRYHKFPEKCTHIHDAKACGEEEYVNILGIQFSNIQPVLDFNGDPVEGIVGYEILVTDRANHKSILHKGLMYNMFEEKLSDCSTSYYANYPFNDLHEDNFLSKTRARRSFNPLLEYLVDFQPFKENGYTAVDTYSKSRFEYISPDVSYERNDAGQYIQLYTEENGPVAGKYSYTSEMPEVLVLSDLDYVMCAVVVIVSFLIFYDLDGALNAGQAALDGFINTVKPKQYATNYYAQTQYRSYNTENIVPGNIRRKINISQYTLPTKMWVGENKVNNFQRESGLFLELCTDILDPFVRERSRIRQSDNMCHQDFGFCEQTNFQEIPVTSSYYAGIKIERPAQYGLPGSSLSRPVSKVFEWDNLSTAETDPILGGDIYITKHKHIRKFPFFTNLPLNTPPKTEYNTEEYMNVWHTRYWFDPGNAASIALLFPAGVVYSLAFATNQQRNLEKTGGFRKVNCGNDSGDCTSIDPLRIRGTFYTHVVGEIEYWCESEYIGGFRELNEIPESNIDRALEEKIQYRTIQYPELYLYNRQYHWKGFAPFVQHSDIDFNCCPPDRICSLNTMAYSVAHDPLRKSDAWTKFLPANLQQFSSKDGNLLGVKEIDDFNLLVFFEDGLYITQQDESLLTDGSRIYIGSPDLFSRRMKKISDDATGFGGCIDLDSVVSCRHGVFWFDRKRKKFCFLDGNAKNITGKIQSWLNENLEGPVSGVYDNYTDSIYYTGTGKNGCRWSLSYKPAMPEFGWRGGWASFHSFTPEGWLPMANNFLTYDENAIWKHNKKYSYGNYYGQQYPFEVGTVIQNKAMAMPQSMEVWSEWATYDGYGRKRYDTQAFFDEMLVYNNLRTTGYKPLMLKDINNTKSYGAQNSHDFVEVTYMEDFTYRINKFDTESTFQPTVMADCMEVISSNVPNVKDPDSEPMRGKWARVHLRSNKNDHKILLPMEVVTNDDTSQ